MSYKANIIQLINKKDTKKDVLKNISKFVSRKNEFISTFCFFAVYEMLNIKWLPIELSTHILSSLLMLYNVELTIISHLMFNYGYPLGSEYRFNYQFGYNIPKLQYGDHFNAKFVRKL